MVAKAASLACFLMKERPGCSQRRTVTFAQCLGRSFGGGHGVLSIKTVAELVESNYFQMPTTPISQIAQLTLATLKTDRMPLPSPVLQKYLLQKSIFSVTIYCRILLSASEKPHGKITMLHLLNWPCRALPGVHASSYKVKRQVCQAHAENIIIKPTRICKSVCSEAHLHSFSLVL